MPPPSRRHRRREKQPTNTVCLPAARHRDVSVVVTSLHALLQCLLIQGDAQFPACDSVKVYKDYI